MDKVAIRAVRTDDGGHVRVRPSAPAPWGDYELIYRDASFVRWDKLTSELYVDPERSFSSFEQFMRMRDAVRREYGDNLVVDAETVFENLADELVKQIRQAAT